MGHHHNPAAYAAAVDIILLFDRSASMSGAPLRHMQQTAKAFLQNVSRGARCTDCGQLPDGMRISVISYASRATFDMPLGSSVKALQQAIDALHAGGKTNHGEGFTLAWQTLAASQAQQKIIMLFTDDCAQKLRRAYQKEGVMLHIVGENTQEDYDEHDLTETGGYDMYNDMYHETYNDTYSDKNEKYEKYNKNDTYDNNTRSCTQLQQVQCDTELENTGRVVQMDVTVRRVCPGKRVALGVMLYEMDERGNQEARGLKTMTIDAHHENCPRDMQVQGIEFVLPDDLALANPRRFNARVIAHHIDTDYQPCSSGVVLR